MTKGIKGLVCVLAALVPATANAWTFDGNPTMSIWVDRKTNDVAAAVVDVEAVRVHNCAGGYTRYTVEQSLDLGAPFTLTISGGDLCGVTVEYGSSMRIEQDDANWVLDYSELYTSVEIPETGTPSSALSPAEVVSGAMSGQYPRLFVTIE